MEENMNAEVEVQNADEALEIRDTDIAFDCPHCGKNLVIDYRGAGLQIDCSECGKSVLVPIPEGMQLTDLDLDSGEILKQLFATRRNYQKAKLEIQDLKQKAELEIQDLKTRLTQIGETLMVVQQVIVEGLANK